MPKKSKKRKSTKSTSRNNRYNNVPLTKRNRFYNSLEGNIGIDYLKYLFIFTIHLNEYYKDLYFEYTLPNENGPDKKYKMTFIPYDTKGNYLEHFGGAIFFMIYYEATLLRLFNHGDLEIMEKFEKYKTIDIDVMAKYNITPNINMSNNNDTDDDARLKSKKEYNIIIKQFSKMYQAFFAHAFEDICYKNIELAKFFSYLVNKKQFRGLKFGNNNSIIDNIMDGYSVNMQITDDGNLTPELRPQLNTCIEDKYNCDHIVEILTKNCGNGCGTIANEYKLNVINDFYGMNILKLCLQNFIRLYDLIKQNTDGTIKRIEEYNSKEKLIKIIKNKFKISPLLKTKYLQGFYRIQLIQLIVSKLITDKSTELNYFKNIFKLNEPVLRIIINNITRGYVVNIVRIFLGSDIVKKNKELLDKINYSKKDGNFTLNDTNLILKLMLQLWISINDEILKLYNSDIDFNAVILKDAKPIENIVIDTNLLMLIKNMDWESKKKIITIYKQLFKKTPPPTTINIINNKIIKKIYKLLFNEDCPILNKSTQPDILKSIMEKVESYE